MKVNYLVTSAEEYLRNIALRSQKSDYEKFHKALEDGNEDFLNNFEFKLGNILEIKGERLVCDLSSDEEFDKVTGMTIWGYIKHMTGDGTIYADLFYLQSASSILKELDNELLSGDDNYGISLYYSEENSSTVDSSIQGDAQIIVYLYEAEDNCIMNWEERLQILDHFLQEFERRIKKDKICSRIIDKFVKNYE